MSVARVIHSDGWRNLRRLGGRGLREFLNETNLLPVAIGSKVYERWWTWVVTPKTKWDSATANGVNVYQSLLIAFFTCIGLNAGRSVAKRGELALVVYLVLATAFVFVTTVRKP